MVDSRGRIVLVNREIERMFQYDRSELMGRPMEMLVPERFRSRHPEDRRNFFRAPDTRAMGAGRDLFGLCKDGTELPIEIGLNPVKTEDGMFVLSSIVDISARKRAEEERDELEQQLRQIQKLDAVSTLAGGIAHDFNNILGGILGFAELLQGAVESPQAREDLERLVAFTQRGKTLIRKIQAFGHPQESERRPLSLADLVGEVTGFLRSSLPPTIEITTAIQDRTPMVIGDPSAIHQVLMNLSVNAVHAMPGGGRLSIDAAPLYVTDSRARAHPHLREGHYVEVSVKDSGTGIDPDLHGRVFEPFFTTRSPGEGSGLGLAIVHRIIRQHEGAVELDSAPGAGTTVRLLLPAVEVDDLGQPSEASAPVPGGGRRILYVDDEVELAALGKRRLEKLDYLVTVAANDSEALEAVRAASHPFDAVITDYLMPGRNGLELAAELLALQPDLPIILLTGFVDHVPVEEIEGSGVRVALRKPVTSGEMATALATVLGI
jgi:PAS domain S-box-containing protein